ncbi:MAG: hypothetical protein ACE5ID_08115, partial [Acidobacteriota bacterium]
MGGTPSGEGLMTRSFALTAAGEGPVAGDRTPIMMRREEGGVYRVIRRDRDYNRVALAPSQKGMLIPIYSTKTFYEFLTFYHPFVCQFKKELRRDGLDGLLQRKLQVWPHLFIPSPSPFSFYSNYLPEDAVKKPYPKEDVDFTATGAYSLYNWELFFHAPLLIAEKLSQNQRFEEAQKWFHYIFNPTDTSLHPSPQRYWQMGWFFNTTTADYQKQKIENMMNLLAQGAADPEITAQVRAWRENPFNPYLVARLRTVAFQKATVMKYLDNLINWGDHVFRTARDPEQLNEATQLYILAAEILGRRPEIVKPRALPVIKTYNEIEPDLDEFSNALVEAEALVPIPADGYSPPVEPPPVTLPALLYFCVPKNDKLLAYWGTVANRLSKIRHCLNIEGQELKLPLFEPPIDPALLIKAAAAGLDLSSILSDLNAPLPHYRFQIMAQKATELVQEVKALGQGLLAALEKKDAEALSLLRAGQEITVLEAVQQVREKQIKEAEETVDQLSRYKELVTLRQQYYQRLLDDGLNASERGQVDQMGSSKNVQIAQATTQFVVAVLALFPELKLGSPTTIGATFGGQNIGGALSAAAGGLGVTAGVLSTGASMSGITGGYDRREEEWQQQVDLATKELEQADKQIAAAKIRQAMPQKELENHKLQIQNAKENEDFLKDKFTNEQLYSWMISLISGVYFQAYQLAYDTAKRAERAYRHELGLEDSSFIQFGYWDGLKKGLLSGEKLHHDLKRLEISFLDNHRREYELTKHVSLALTNPEALLTLKQTGECFFPLPESLFDLDQPGHYMRRIKSVSMTIPAVAGPYNGVHATLTLMKSTIRHDATAPVNGYARDLSIDDLR